MLEPSSFRFLIQKTILASSIISLLLITVILITLNPNDNLLYLSLMNCCLFVFSVSMMYNIYELYISFIKKEIMTLEQSLRTLLYVFLINTNLFVFFIYYQTDNINLLSLLSCLLLILTSYIYAQKN